MPPTKDLNASGTPQPKKQQSISKFFSARSGAGAPSAAVAAASRPLNGAGDAIASCHSSSAGSDVGATSLPNRPSSRGSKRTHDTGDNAVEEQEEEKTSRKRSRGLNLQADRTQRGKGSERALHTVNRHRSLVTDRSKAIKEPAATGRTSRFVFSGSVLETNGRSGGVEKSGHADDDELHDGMTRQEKDRLHERFVKRLGRPDSIAEIKRRSRPAADAPADNDEDASADHEEGGVDDDDPDVPAGQKGQRRESKGRQATAGRKGAAKLTPMEKQVLEIKRAHMDTLLVVEVGYKFRFFGEDARTAAKELGIVCIPGKYRYDEHPSEAHLDRFASASIPVHRLHVHVKRLVTAGHKVGVVRQLETAALKAAGDNRNAPFTRKLTDLYTKGTYVDDLEGLAAAVVGAGSGANSTGYILCVTETNSKGWGSDEKAHVGLVAVQPATGEIIYDDFEDGFMRSEIETRLLHIAPCELLVLGELSKVTEKLIQHLSGSKSNVFGDRARVERVPKSKSAVAESYSHISNFYADKMKSCDAGDVTTTHVLDKAHKLSEHVTLCLSATIKHMTEYGLEHVFDLTKNFQPFSARSHMMLNGNTLTSLEIYQNQTDQSERGSLFWIMNKTKTRFGQRLMRKWVGRPLLFQKELEERLLAVEELHSRRHLLHSDKLEYLLSNIKIDLEKSLIRIYYKKCSRSELLNVLHALQRIANGYANAKSPKDTGFDSGLLSEAILRLPAISDEVILLLEQINPQAAKADDKYAFFREEYETEVITEHKLGIACVEMELKDHLTTAAEKLKRKKVDYTTVAGIEYLIEVENSQLKNVPAPWAKISGTKKVSRFHTPEVVRMLRERDQHKEALAAACDDAFKELLVSIGAKYQTFRDCVQSLAVLDCLVSLSEVARQPGYVKPEFTSEAGTISVSKGRHPMVEQLLLDSYVANDVELRRDATRALLITGPNMGGKSSYVRQVALICIMGQIGSYVPADGARLSLVDAVFTRMGALDNMLAGESTFMVELSETADILRQASPRSLVLLDELGRGTSTHDGVAIAHAVLDHIVRQLHCLTLFITHYQSLAAGFDDAALKNVHMRFTEAGQDGQEITFLYEVGDGVAHRSYGLNVARLANIPDPVLAVAGVKSKELEIGILRKRMTSLSQSLKVLFEQQQHEETSLEDVINSIEQL